MTEEVRKMKYHINNDYEVKPCGASDETRCPFFGRDGETNHFNNQEEAILKAEEKLDQKHGNSNRTKKNPTQFNKNKEFIQEAIVEYGNVQSKEELQEVSNVKEMVSEWFDGDRRKYNEFRRLIDDKGFTPETKKSVAHLILRGIPVRKKKSVHDLSEKPKNSTETSEITILEESDEKIDWDTLSPELFSFKNN